MGEPTGDRHQRHPRAFLGVAAYKKRPRDRSSSRGRRPHRGVNGISGCAGLFVGFADRLLEKTQWIGTRIGM
jgi:hypothetical protein